MKSIQTICLGLAISSTFFSCNSSKQPEPKTSNQNETKFHNVQAKIETEAIPSVEGEDAADDPAVWIHPTYSDKSLIIGTNKKGGIVIYNLAGKQLKYHQVGRVNNIDVSYGFELNAETKVDLIGASNRTDSTLLLRTIDESGEISPILNEAIHSDVGDVYGFCFFTSPETKKTYAFINGKSGKVEQWKLIAKNNQITGKLVRSFKIDTQVEGMVADSETSKLYIGEEGKGIWEMDANPSSDSQKTLFPESTMDNNINIKYDIEGITIYYGKNGGGYIIASSQGNNSYAVFERKGNHKYLGSFAITSGKIDGAEETDGIDVCNVPLGSQFPNGLFIAQDGFNKEGGNDTPQNFKLVDWNEIAKSFPENLQVNLDYKVRQ